MATQARIPLLTVSTCICLAMSMMVLWSSFGVHASPSGAELVYFEDELQKSLDLLTCAESRSFIQDHAIFQTPNSSSADMNSLSDESIGSCKETKTKIHDVLARSLENSKNGTGNVIGRFLPPIVCFECKASLCRDDDACLACCFRGDEAPCYVCP